MQELSPLRTEYLQVNYAKAGDLAALIKSGPDNSLLSERGSVAIDERTNTLLLQDTSERLADIRRLVSTLDIPVRQVHDRSAHRDRQRRLQPRARRALRRQRSVRSRRQRRPRRRRQRQRLRDRGRRHRARRVDAGRRGTSRPRSRLRPAAIRSTATW